MNLNKHLLKEFLGGHWERNEQGKIFLPRSNVILGGQFDFATRRNGEIVDYSTDDNIIVNEGLNSVLSIYLKGGTQITTWYIGIFEADYTPLATDTAANIASNATESTAYDESVRQTWTGGSVSSQSVDNMASRSTFTMNATKTIYGAFLVSSNVKSGTAGTLFAAAKSAAPKSLTSSDELLVGYTLNASDA